MSTDDVHCGGRMATLAQASSWLGVRPACCLNSLACVPARQLTGEMPQKLRALPASCLECGNLAAIAHRHLKRSLVRTLLSAIWQYGQWCNIAIAVAQPLKNEVISEPRVLGKDRA